MIGNISARVPLWKNTSPNGNNQIRVTLKMEEETQRCDTALKEKWNHK